MSRGRKVLVAHSYFLRYDAKQLQKMKPYPPLATLMVAAGLRQRGYEVSFFDAMLSNGVEDFEAALAKHQPAVVAIVEDNFNFLTKMCTLRMREAALHMIHCADARDCRVLVNGSDAADHPALYLEAGADAVVLGEPDLTVPEVLDAWATGASDIEHIAGLALARPPRSVTRTKHRPAVHELDELPNPAWDLVDVDAYRTAWHDAHGRFSINLVASRGCPYGCNWCAKPLFGRGYAQRSPASLAAELAWVKEHIRPDHIWFADDIFGLTPAWLESFAQEVEARSAAIPFTIQSRVNLMTERSVSALRNAGCEEVWLGVESGSQRVLDAMDKGSRVEQVRTATALLGAAGVRPCWFIQLGYLGEEWDDIVLTRTLIRECAPADIGVSVAYPLPGTKFYDAVRAQLGMRRNWVDTDELAVLFHGTYTTEFYRRIRDLLHDEVRAPGADYDSAWNALASTRDQFRNELLQAVGG